MTESHFWHCRGAVFCRTGSESDRHGDTHCVGLWSRLACLACLPVARFGLPGHQWSLSLDVCTALSAFSPPPFNMRELLLLLLLWYESATLFDVDLAVNFGGFGMFQGDQASGVKPAWIFVLYERPTADP